MYKQMIMADQLYVAQLITLGNTAFKEGRNEEALAFFQRVLMGTSAPQVKKKNLTFFFYSLDPPRIINSGGNI